MRAILRNGAQRRFDDLCNLFVRNGSGTAGPRRVFQYAGHPAGFKSLTNCNHALARNADTLRDLGIRKPLGSVKDHSRSANRTLLAGVLGDEFFQSPKMTWTYPKRRSRR